ARAICAARRGVPLGPASRLPETLARLVPALRRVDADVAQHVLVEARQLASRRGAGPPLGDLLPPPPATPCGATRGLDGRRPRRDAAQRIRYVHGSLRCCKAGTEER